MNRPILATAAALLAGCGLQIPNSDPSNRWAGTVTPATPSPDCQKSRGIALIRAQALQFAPDEGTWILTGTATPNGEAVAERTQTGADKKPYTTQLQARWTTTTLTGTYTTPRCTFTVDLKRI